MPLIDINLADVVAFESLPVGSYLAQIQKIKFNEAKEAGKFPQLQVTYIVIDGEFTGRIQSEWISFSDKALFRMKRWFNKFGMGDIPTLNVDDDTSELTEPDLYDIRVIISVTQRKNDATRFDTDLVSVEDEIVAAPLAPATAPVQAAPVVETVATPVEATVAAAPAAVAVADPTPVEEAAPEPVEAPVAEAAPVVAATPPAEVDAPPPRRRAASPARAAATPATVQRNTLR